MIMRLLGFGVKVDSQALQLAAPAPWHWDVLQRSFDNARRLT